MKYWMLILCFACANSSAAIIQWNFKTHWQAMDINTTPLESTVSDSTIVINSETFEVTAGSFQSDLFDWTITGSHTISEFHEYHSDLGLRDGGFGGDILDDGNATHFVFLNFFLYQPQSINPAENLNLAFTEFYTGIIDDRIWVGYATDWTKTIISTGEEPAEVPEPATLALLSLGLAGLVRRRS